MAFGKKKTNKAASRTAVPDLWADTVEAPRANVVDPDKIARRALAYRAILWMCPPALVLVSLALIVQLGKPAGPGGPAQVAADNTGESSPGRAAATMELSKWAAQNPSPLPGAYVISWDGADPVNKTEVPKGQDGQSGGASTDGLDDTSAKTKYEIDKFTVGSSSGTYFEASVEVAIDGRSGGAKAVSGLSLLPKASAPDDGFDQTAPWPGLEKVTAPSAVNSAVQSWATAYTSGNANVLSQAVQDPVDAHKYLPISGATGVASSVTTAAKLPKNPHMMVAQVSLAITWKGQSAPKKPTESDSSDSDKSGQTTMDVLVSRADSAAPVVVAWGPPGSGPALKPYQNADPDAQSK